METKQRVSMTVEPEIYAMLLKYATERGLQVATAGKVIIAEKLKTDDKPKRQSK